MRRQLVVALCLLVLLPIEAQALPGELDTSFSDDGKVTTTVGTTGFAYAVAVDSLGRTYAAGSTQGSEYDFAVVRYTTGGLPDTSFSGDGIAKTDVGGGGALDIARGVAIDDADRAVVAGFTSASGNWGVVRFKVGGRRDPTFSGDGVALTPIGATASADAVAIQPDGKIVVVGRATSKMAIARYETGGALDRTFSRNGTAYVGFGASSEAQAVAIDDDGSIVIAGYSGTGPDWKAAIARLTAEGILDPTFSGDGKTTLNWSPGDDEAYGVALTPSGKIVVGGFVSSGPGGSDVAVARLLPDGTPDDTWSADGYVQTDLAGGNETVRGLALNGKKVVAAGYTSAGNGDIAVVRYREGGKPDTTFGGDGIVLTDISGGGDVGYAVAVDGGTAVVAGSAPEGFAAARYLLA